MKYLFKFLLNRTLLKAETRFSTSFNFGKLRTLLGLLEKGEFRFVFEILRDRLVKAANINLTHNLLKMLSLFNTNFQLPDRVASKSRKIKSIGIVVTSFRENPYLEECLLSVKNQSENPNQLVIVVSGDIDNYITANRLVKSLKLSAVVIHTDENTAGANRNAGASICNTDYIVFLDGDDLLTKCALETFRNNISDSNYIYGSSCLTFPEFSTYFIAHEIHLSSLRVFNRLNITAAIPKCEFNELGGFRESIIAEEHLPEDWDFWIRAVNRGVKIRGITFPQYLYRKHDTSTSACENGLPDVKNEFWRYAVNAGSSSYWRSNTPEINSIEEYFFPPTTRERFFVAEDYPNVETIQKLIGLSAENPDIDVTLICMYLEHSMYEYLLEFSKNGIGVIDLSQSFTSYSSLMRYLLFVRKIDSKSIHSFKLNQKTERLLNG